MIFTKNQIRSSSSKFISHLNSVSLDNGLTLIHQHVPSSAIVVADIWINAGVTTESPLYSGISHFLEHMVFKGSESILPGDFDQIIESKGGFANAATSYDYTHFFLTTATSQIFETLPYLAEILLQPAITEESFNLEREVVLEEIRCTQDDHDWIIFQALIQSIYQNHPYSRSVLGQESLLINYSPLQMLHYHASRYQADKMNIVLVGDITKDKAIDLVEKCFHDFRNIPAGVKDYHFESETPMKEIRRQTLCLPRLKQPRLIIGWTVEEGIVNLEGAIALDMLSVILTGGRTSRLTQKLREQKQLVIDISCDFSLQKHSSLFTITAYSTIDDLSELEHQIIQEIEKLRRYPISENELHRCQKSLCHDYIFSTETPEQLAALYGYYQILEQADLALKYPSIVNNLSVEKLQKYAFDYLSPDCYATCCAYPAIS